MNKKVLVTGVCGFIGSHVVEELSQETCVVGVDDLFSGKRENVHPNNLDEFVESDFASPSVLDRVRSGEFEQVIHLAAKASVPWSVQNPIESHRENLTKTLDLLEASRQGKVKRFVFASSSAVYGNGSGKWILAKSQEPVPFRETDRTQCLSPYALQKKTVEDYARLLVQGLSDGFEVVCLRYFNVFGPRQSVSGPYANVIASWSDRIVHGLPLTIYGDGQATRDYVYVKDVARATVKALTAERGLSDFSVLNVGSGKSTKLVEILGMFQEIVGRDKPLKSDFQPERAGDARATLAYMDYSEKVLGFKPESGNLKENIKSTLDWYRTNS